MGIIIGATLPLAFTSLAQTQEIQNFPSIGDLKYATSSIATSENIDIIKENFENTTEINKRLDKIILLLQKIVPKK